MLKGQKITLNVPNLLSLSRIPLTLAAILIHYLGWKNPTDQITLHWVATSLVFLIGLTDFLDGRLARRAGLPKNGLGAILDERTDKFFAWGCFIYLAIIGLCDWEVPVLFILRDVTVTYYRKEVENKTGQAVSAKLFGKLKTVFQFLCVGLYFVPLFSDAGIKYFISTAILDLTVVLSLISGLQVCINCSRILNSKD